MMKTEEPKLLRSPLERLAEAVAAWESGGELGGLDRWALEQGPGGILAEDGPMGWAEALRQLGPVLKRRSVASESVRTQVERLRAAVAAFRRPDGTLAFGPTAGAEAPVGRSPSSVSFATREEGVVRAALRDRVAGAGQLLAIDHSAPGTVSGVELHALGRNWLGAIEAVGVDGAAVERPRWTAWLSGPEGDLAEYRFAVGSSEVERLVLALRGRRRLILIADAWKGLEAAGPASKVSLRLGLADGIETVAAEEAAVGLRLRAGEGTAESIRVIAPGLSTKAGGRGGVARAIAGHGTRAWVPLALDLEPGRAERVPSWTALTITDERRIVGLDEAVAFRLSWAGQTESLVVYRSLVKTERRVFLGYQTGARFVVAAFSRKGEMTPLIELPESRS